jgi:transporter family protein
LQQLCRKTGCVRIAMSDPHYPDSMTWLIWALLSATFAAATAILAKIGVAGIDSNLATAIRTTVVLVFTWAIAIALGKHNAISAIAARSWLFLALSGIATGLSWLCYFRALQLGPASAVAPIDKLSVVLVILLAWIFLGEGLTAHKILGGLLIAGGAATLVFG